ncbi:MAG: hypothetical protein NDI90_08395 [Nitrospira sp. BO4]|jgi:hypothetical protein|nr:hypothetical protein [Nitrospira sp. BO4]
MRAHTLQRIVIIFVLMLLSLAGCYWTLEQRWQAFDEQTRQEVGAKTKDYYVHEWGNPSKQLKTIDGEEVCTWEWRGYGGSQGWNKTLKFSPVGVLKDFHREYWPKD